MKSVFFYLILSGWSQSSYGKTAQCPAAAELSFSNFSVQRDGYAFKNEQEDVSFLRRSPEEDESTPSRYFARVESVIKDFLSGFSGQSLSLREISDQDSNGLCSFMGDSNLKRQAFIEARLLYRTQRNYRPYDFHPQVGDRALILELKISLDIRDVAEDFPNYPGYANIFVYIWVGEISESRVVPRTFGEKRPISMFIKYGIHSNQPDPHIIYEPIALGGIDSVKFEVP